MPVDVLDIDHYSVVVADTRRALRFYGEVLGLAQVHERPDLGYPGAWLRVGDYQIHLLQVANPDPVEGRPEHGGRDRHLAMRVGCLETIRDRLEQAGVGYSLSRSGRKALFCRDPDGNAIELIEKNG